jgi:hypothetical protein
MMCYQSFARVKHTKSLVHVGSCPEARAFVQILDPCLPYDEAAALAENLEYLTRSLGVSDITILSADGPDVPESVRTNEGPYPAEPRAILTSATPEDAMAE